MTEQIKTNALVARASIDDIVWGTSESVWNDTFDFIMLGKLENTGCMNEVLEWIVSKRDEYLAKHLKVSTICDSLQKARCDATGAVRLLMHYEHILLRYDTAHDSCRAVYLMR
jgi:hypothetical protein